jgi:hypothetical protein
MIGRASRRLRQPNPRASKHRFPRLRAHRPRSAGSGTGAKGTSRPGSWRVARFRVPARGRRRLGDAFVVQVGKLLAHVLDNLPAPRLAFERGSYDLAELARIRMPSRLTAADAGTAIVSSSSAVATKRPGSPGKSSANRWPIIA